MFCSSDIIFMLLSLKTTLLYEQGGFFPHQIGWFNDWGIKKPAIYAGNNDMDRDYAERK